MATLVNIDVINKTIPLLNHENIPVINRPNPCYGYMANAKEVKQLIQMPNYWIYEAGTKIIISGNNYYDYFPEESGIPESVSKEEIQKMIDDSVPEVDSVISTTSTNAIQNSTITNFVNSSVSTNTANYIGLFNSVEELNAYTGTVTNNDYAFVVGEDESGNTKYDRYKWTEETDGWLMEYTLNNSSFTSEEWAAIQSGIKAQDVEKIKKNEEDISDLSTNKADKTELVGKNMTGETCNIRGTEYTAGVGAEIFNDYSNAKAVGMYSHAENAGTAVGQFSHCEGQGTISLGNYSHSEGGGTTASGDQSHAEGSGTTASGGSSHSEGGGTTASGGNSHSEGGGTTASGAQSHAEGGGTTASGGNSHAEGGFVTASGSYSHAEGFNTKASSDNQHVQGKYNVEDTESKYAFIIGNGTSNSSRSNAFAVDWNGVLYVNNSSDGVNLNNLVGKNVTNEEFTIDDTTYTAKSGAEIFNDYSGNIAIGMHSHSEGSGNVVLGDYAHSEGNNTKAEGYASHTEGYYTNATGSYSHAEGNNTKASGDQAHAEGQDTTASGDYSHAEGYGSTATMLCSHAEGNSTHSTGSYAHAEGQDTTASGYSSHSEGSNTKASGESSHAEGASTEASGTYAHAEGIYTHATGSYAHAEGDTTTASGQASHAEGYNTLASSENQHVSGKFNVEDTENKYAFIIGNGSGLSSRSNAFAIDWEGKIWQGNSSIGVQVSQNVDLTLEEYEALSDEEKNNGVYYNIIES